MTVPYGCGTPKQWLMDLARAQLTEIKKLNLAEGGLVRLYPLFWKGSFFLSRREYSSETSLAGSGVKGFI